jgi:hypothetical protein
MISNQPKLRLRNPLAAILTSTLLLPALAHADVTYQETTQITGGSMVGMIKMAGAFSSAAKQLNGPMTTRVMIHGNRMVRLGLHQSQIIDLDQQTITSIDHDKHSYSVTTFQEMEQQLGKAAGQAKGATSPDSSASQMAFDAHVTSSGATREIDGQSAAEALLTVTMTSTQADANKAGMAATLELWSIADCPGLAELRAFNQRMSKELSVQAESSSLNSLLASQPGGPQAVEELKKESAKMSGFPVLQVTRVGLTADGKPLPAPSTAPLAQNNDQGGSTAAAITKEVAAGTATQTANDEMAHLGTFGRALSGSAMGSMMHHKPKATPAAGTTAATTAPDPTAGVLLEMQTQTSGFSIAPVETTSLDVPAGYKVVPSPFHSK